MVKFLIVRFSSIGDIILTTPVIRSLKEQVEGAEVHFLTQPAFEQILTPNPHIDKIFTLKEKFGDTIKELIAENYDYIIDLHHNLRTARVKRSVPVHAFSFNKLNIKKWLLVNFKINLMPNVHIVDRYFDTVHLFDVTDDHKGLDYFIPSSEEIIAKDKHAAFEGKYMAVVLGANHKTKQIPLDKLTAIINGSGVPVCLIGGSDVANDAVKLEATLKVPFLNTVGKISLHNSASFIKQSALVLTPDTGMMHIAAAFKKPILSLWGNTVPELGMTPYYPNEKSMIFETNGLRCRPCSKIGFDKCPKKHFKCMNNISNANVISHISNIVNSTDY